MTELSNTVQWDEADFLTPEQRLDAIAEVLGEIALHIVRNEHEQDETL